MFVHEAKEFFFFFALGYKLDHVPWQGSSQEQKTKTAASSCGLALRPSQTGQEVANVNEKEQAGPIANSDVAPKEMSPIKVPSLYTPCKYEGAPSRPTTCQPSREADIMPCQSIISLVELQHVTQESVLFCIDEMHLVGVTVNE